HVQDPAHLPRLLTSHFWDIEHTGERANATYQYLYRPVVSLAYLAQWTLFEGQSLGFHVVSLVLHLCCVVLVFRWLGCRLGMVKGATAGVLIGTALFGLHPTRVESVAWISGSTDLWMTFFVFLGLWAWDRGNTKSMTAAAFVGLVLGLFSKEAAVVVPVLLLSDAILLGRGPEERRRALWLGAAFVVPLLFRLWTVPLGGPVDSASVLDGPSRQSEPVNRILSSFGLYLRHTLWPTEPTIRAGLRHSDAGVELFDPLFVTLGAIGGAAILAFLFAAHRKKALRPLLADLLWFIVPLVPVLNVADIGADTLISERFLYLPMVGLSALVARLVARCWAMGSRPRTMVLLGAVVALAPCAWIARGHVPHFKDNLAFWEHAYETGPNSMVTISALSRLYRHSEDPAVVLALLQRGYEVAQAEKHVAWALTFSLTGIAEMLSVTADADRQTIGQIAEAYLGVERHSHLRFSKGPLRIDLPLDARGREFCLSTPTDYGIPRAIALMRAGQRERATSDLENVVETMSHPGAWSLLVR
ncbi:MAG: hypothetical protein KC416_15605, partial [Myxococcales bacterium]|nr:hypothetical protein [Myxococcales bacterium]